MSSFDNTLHNNITNKEKRNKLEQLNTLIEGTNCNMCAGIERNVQKRVSFDYSLLATTTQTKLDHNKKQKFSYETHLRFLYGTSVSNYRTIVFTVRVQIYR